MTAHPIGGKNIARSMKEAIRKEISELGIDMVTLAAVEAEDPSGGAGLYAASQKKSAENVGISFRHVLLPEGVSEARLLETIEDLNRDETVHGIVLLRPLPSEIDMGKISLAVHPDKDVEGMHPFNLGALAHGSPRLVPCTALASVTLLRSTGIEVKGLETVVVGHSEIVGKPIALLMVNDLSTVTMCHIGTKDLKAHTSRADILFVAAGVPNLITGDMVKPGAMVIDIGINRIAVDDGGARKTKVVGDVDFESVSAVAGRITPVPGGVGPVTAAVLMQNTLRAAAQSIGAKRD